MTPEAFATEWERCAPWLQAALTLDPTHTLEQVRKLCESLPAQFQFWPGRACACVTQVIEQPQLLELHMWLAGGDLAEILRAYPSVEAFARQLGCARVTSYVRPGFVKALAPLGFHQQFVAVSKELSDGR